MARILIVDDSPTEMFKMTELLQKQGHEVLSAEGGEQGVAMAKSELPDLILMDVVMPGINGFQATRQITRNPSTSSIPVLMVTTKNQETDRLWGERQGASGYLTKPIDSDQLLKEVSKFLP